MPSIDVSKVLSIITERKAEDIRKNKILTYFPDSGPFRRELYQRHVEFFDAGARYKERLFMAANRCNTPWSPLEMGHATRRFGELIGAGGFDVRSWDGGSQYAKQASPVFLKSIEPAFRVLLDNGQFWDCSGGHLVLTSEGWTSVAQLIRDSGGLLCSQTHGDYQASSDTDGRSCGEQFHRLGYSGQGNTPSLDGVLGHSLFSAPLGGAGTKPSHTNSQIGDHLSIRDDLDLTASLCEKSEDPDVWLEDIWSASLRQDLLRYGLASFPLLEADPFSIHQLSRPWFWGVQTQFVFGASMPRRNSTSNQGYRQSTDETGRELQVLEFLERNPRTSIFLPLNHPLLVGGTKIQYIIPVGLQPILDFTVRDTHNYISHGVIHHNCGKSDSGAFESTCHATGIYPAWWTGRRFDKPTEGWACGTTGETTRDIVQAKLVGPVGQIGTGFIPAHLITKTTSRRGGIADALESIVVKHISGKHSLIGLKSYQQGRESFEGTSKDYIWFDEEPPQDVYTEGLYRTVTTKGVVFTTFTPLQGMSDVVRGFKEPESDESEKHKWYVQAGWDDVPHIDENEKSAVIATTPPYQIEARTKGEPALGSGAIYPIPERDITLPNEPIPMSWPRCYAMDVGWNRTAVLWAARNPATSQVVVYDEYYQGMGEPASHVYGIKSRGDWIPGVIDPASKGRSQIDGQQLLTVYRKLGLQLSTADNTVESGIMDVWNMMVTGQLKVQAKCFNFFSEFRQYHRDDKGKGKIVKKYDHLMDCLRYLVSSGLFVMKLRPIPQMKRLETYNDHNGRGWMI